MEFPNPVIEIAVEPKTKGIKKMGEALGRLAKEDLHSESLQMKSLSNNY